MSYPIDNPLDGSGRTVGGEIEAGRAAMPADTDRHTPGPWQAGPTLFGVTWLVTGANGAWLATVHGENEVTGPAAQANAALITAAPTMLAALRLALPELREDLETLVECHTVGWPSWSANMPLPDNLSEDVQSIAADKKAAFDAVVAAIAAAEGRA
jgi:hypothetical protein